MTIDVTSVNDAPTLTNFADAIVSTNEDTEVEISLSQLLAQGNEADIDGTVDGFAVQTLTSGTLRIGATQATATAFAAGTNDTINATNKAYWTPAQNVNGDTVAAFTVRAQDNDGLLSSTAIQITVDVAPVNDLPQGQLVFTGVFQQGQVISVDISQITDIDGLGAVTYQWQRNAQDITGATGASYSLLEADVGTIISVVESYTDSDGTVENVLGNTPHIANSNGIVEIDVDNDGTVDVIGVVGDTALDNGNGTYTFISGSMPEVQVTLPVADNANQTTQIVVSNGVASIDLGNNGQIDVNVPSNTTITPNPNDSTVTVSDNASSGNVTVPADSNTTIEFNSNGTTDIDLGDNGHVVTVPADEDVILTPNPDNADQTDIDLGGNGHVVTVPADEDVIVTPNPDNADQTDIDLGGNGHVVTVPADEDVIVTPNADNTDQTDIDLGGNGHVVTVPADEDVIVTPNPDNADQTDIDLGDNGHVVTVPADEDITITPNVDNALDIDIGSDGNNDVTVPADQNITITPNPDGDINIVVGNNPVIRAVVPKDARVDILTSGEMLITTKSGQQYIAGSASSNIILADSVNIYTNVIKEKILASNVDGGYIISGRSALAEAEAFVSDQPLRFEEAFSGFESNTIFTIPSAFNGSGDGSVESPLSTMSNFSQPVKVGSLLSSDEISAFAEGLDANEGSIEVERLGNKIDIYFRPDRAFSGTADFSLKIYQGGVLYDEKYFEVEVSARADVIATHVTRVDVADTSVGSDAYSMDNMLRVQAKDQVDSKPEVRELINISRSEFKEALDQGKAIEQLSEIVKNTLQLAIETNSVSNIAAVASEMLQVSLQAEKTPSLVVRSVFEQTLDSNMTNSDIAFVLSKMILDSDEDKQKQIIQAIVSEPKLNAEHIANMYDYLQEQSPELAEAFANEVKQSKDEDTVNDAANISDALSMELQDTLSEGLLAKLKAKIFGIHAVLDHNTMEYSEIKHRHKLSVAKSNLLELGNKQNNQNSKG